jgi:hypothetical protein
LRAQAQNGRDLGEGDEDLFFSVGKVMVVGEVYDKKEKKGFVKAASG